MSVETNLILALVSADNGTPLRVGQPVRTIALPDLRREGYGCRPVFEAAAALCAGQSIDMACSGPHGLTWRVEWHDRFNPKRVRYAGVLDPHQRLFTTTAPGAHALSGFALAAIGLAWATPRSGFQGEWSSLLATYGASGASAFTTRCFEALRDSILDALSVRDVGATRDTAMGAHGLPMWRCISVADVLDLPALDDEPHTLAMARRRYANTPTAAVMGDLGLFAATSATWRRDVEQFHEAVFIGTQHRDLMQALHAGQHAVLVGPPGEGKSLCVRDVFARLEERKLLRATLDEVPLALFNSAERLFGAPGSDGTWIDGPLRTAMTADGGSLLHLSCVGEPSDDVMSLLCASVRQSSLPAGLVPGAPATVVGPGFRLVLELTVPERTLVERGTAPTAEPTAAALQGIAEIAWLTFVPPTGPEAELLVHGSGECRQPSLLYLVRYVVDAVTRAFVDGDLPRRVSSAEILSWVRMATSMMVHATAGDEPEMLENAARASWVQSMPGARGWWNSTRPLSRGEAVLRRHQRHGVLPDAPTDWADETVGADAWFASERIRQTIDDLTACVAPDSCLILEGAPARRSEYGAMSNGWWTIDSPFCTIRMYSDRPCVEAFVDVVNVAAHERAHARWSPAVMSVYFPAGRQVPDNESPEQYQQRMRVLEAFNLIEDHRIERLLDTLEEPTLQHYRQKAAEHALALYSTLGGPISRRIATCLHVYTIACTVDPEHAWQRAMDLGHESGVPPVHMMSALHLLSMVRGCLEDFDPLPDLLSTLADLFARADGDSPHAPGNSGALEVSGTARR